MDPVVGFRALRCVPVDAWEETAEVVTILGRALPELESHRLTLVDDYGEEPGPLPVLNQLADFVADLLDQDPLPSGLLARCFSAIEDILLEADEEEAREAVAFGFLDALGPDALARVTPWMETGTLALLEALEAGEMDPDASLDLGPDDLGPG